VLSQALVNFVWDFFQVRTSMNSKMCALTVLSVCLAIRRTFLLLSDVMQPKYHTQHLELVDFFGYNIKKSSIKKSNINLPLIFITLVYFSSLIYGGIWVIIQFSVHDMEMIFK
jgi:hypothetical protein